MSKVPFPLANETVDRFLELLSGIGIDLTPGPRTEGDALSMTEVIELWRGRGELPSDPRPILRAAMGSLILQGKFLLCRVTKAQGNFIRISGSWRPDRSSKIGLARSPTPLPTKWRNSTSAPSQCILERASLLMSPTIPGATTQT